MMATENGTVKNAEVASAKLSFKTCAYFTTALIAAVVIGFELGSSPWKAQASDWKNQAADWETQSKDWKAKAAENALYADRWEAEAKRALDLAGRCALPSLEAN